MLVLTLFLLLIVCSLVKYIFHIRQMENSVKNITTLKPWLPFIGNASFFMGKSLDDVLQEFMKIVFEKGTPLKAQLGPAIFILLDNPEDVKNILTSSDCLDKPYVYGFLNSPQGLLTQRSGRAWKPTRKILNPMFNLKILQSFLPIFNEKASNFVENIEKEVNKPLFDVMQYSNICTLSSVCSTIMGFDLDPQSEKGRNFIDSMTGIFDCIAMRLTKPWAHLGFIYRWTNMYKEEQKHWANLRYFTNRIFDDKTRVHLSTSNKIENCPLISLYFDGTLSVDMVKQQIETFAVGGYETTATTISFAILMLAMHPNIQEELYDELHSNYDKQDAETTHENMLNLHLLDRVIKETMRLFPPVAILGRTISVDFSVSNCFIPKGAIIAIPVYTMHRRKDIWGEDAEKFNPDHFSPENVQKRHSFAYLPFSGGPRNCIGYQYAMFTMKVMLSAVLRHYKFTTELSMADLKFKYELIFKLINKHMVRVERRRW